MTIIIIIFSQSIKLAVSGDYSRNLLLQYQLMRGKFDMLEGYKSHAA